jgi:aryl-alcohol dehydrogenase-like predicted oxidoreductase
MIERVALGTVQWGTPYGIANRTGQPSSGEVRTLLDRARELGIDTLDTARAYGDAERVLGSFTGRDPWWRVITKLDPDCAPPGVSPREAAVLARRSIEESRAALRRERIDVVLLHRASHREAADGAVWSTLLELASQGVVGTVGVSAGTPEEALRLLDEPDVAVLQVAASLVDRRLEKAGFFERARRAKKVVYVRSVFLQGALLLAEVEIPSALSSLRAVVRRISERARALGSTPRDALLAYAHRRLDATLVLGCESVGQLNENAASLTAPEWSDAELRALAESFPVLPDDVLDPAKWLPKGA